MTKTKQGPPFGPSRVLIESQHCFQQPLTTWHNTKNCPSIDAQQSVMHTTTPLHTELRLKNELLSYQVAAALLLLSALERLARADSQTSATQALFLSLVNQALLLCFLDIVLEAATAETTGVRVALEQPWFACNSCHSCRHAAAADFPSHLSSLRKLSARQYRSCWLAINTPTCSPVKAGPLPAPVALATTFLLGPLVDAMPGTCAAKQAPRGASLTPNHMLQVVATTVKAGACRPCWRRPGRQCQINALPECLSGLTAPVTAFLCSLDFSKSLWWFSSCSKGQIAKKSPDNKHRHETDW